MKKIIIIIVVAVLLVASIVWKSISYNPHHLTIRSEVLKSSKIDPSLDGTSIVYFTDLHYGVYTNMDDVNNCIELINKLDPDVIVFGGDLIDSEINISQEEKQELASKLKSLKANQGKYYVHGNHDLFTVEREDETLEILALGDFISLVRTNFKIYNGTSSYFNIVGLDSYLYGDPEIASAYNDVDSSKYTISFIHCPDKFNHLPLDNTDYVIAGHSHGGQIYIPLFEHLYRSKGSEQYFHGKYKKNTTTLDISNGVGLTRYSIRFNAPAEIVYYKLKSD